LVPAGAASNGAIMGPGAAVLADLLPAILTAAHGRLCADSAAGAGAVVERAALVVAVAVKHCSGVLAEQTEVVSHLVEALVQAQQHLRALVETTYGAGAQHDKRGTGGAASDDGSDEDEDGDDDDGDGIRDGHMGPGLEVLHFALDNITSALGNVAVLLQRSDVAALWLASLPIQVDFAEGDWTYKLLCEQVEAQNPTVVGGDGHMIPRIIEVLSAAAETDKLDDEVRLRAEQIRDRLAQAMSH